MYAGYHEEGDKCPVSGCGGTCGFRAVENCSCHISPPCHRCVDNPLVCLTCGWTNEDEPEAVYVQVAPGLLQREVKPRQLDSTKIDYRTKMHTHFTQIAEGVYPEGTTRDQVEAVVKGTFGGRFESFGGGKFRYIQYTD